MSASPAEEGGPAPSEAVELPPHGDSAFAALMDAMVPDEAAAPAGEVGTPAEPAAGEAAGASGQPAGGTGSAPAAPAKDAGSAAPGAAGDAEGGSEQPPASAGAADRPAAWTAEAAALAPKFGELSTALEENTAKAFQATALDEVREEHKNYFDALAQHPRLLVGREVPAIGREGNEQLKSTEDAREWQEAVKHVLVAEVKSRAESKVEESRDFLQTVHASIELFQNNSDLIPGTKGFDVELANSFATLAQPYEIRVDGNLQGYSIPVQPIIDKLRSDLTAKRASTAAPAAGAAASPATPAAGAAPADPPQAGIPSKSGSGSSSEDFSALFGTLGLHNIRI